MSMWRVLNAIGIDKEEITSYKTHKYVNVRDWRLGAIDFCSKIVILVYVVVHTIIYHGSHLKERELYGSTRMTIQHPTEHCNPLKPQCNSTYHDLANLPYCRQYKENGSSSDDVAKRLKELKLQHTCSRMDGLDMSFGFPHPGILFVPSRNHTRMQDKGCDPEATGVCQNLWTFPKEAENHDDTYIPEIADFTVLLDHSFHIVLGGDQFGVAMARDLDGSISQVKDISQPKDAPYTVHRGIRTMILPNVSQTRLPGYESAISFPFGDVISVGDLLKMADPQGREGKDLLDVVDQDAHEGGSLRFAGGKLIIIIEYSNKQLFDPFGQAPIQYTIRAVLMPEPENKVMKTVRVADAKRSIVDIHGISIMAMAHGKVRVFSLNNLIMVLTTGLALLTASRVLTNFIMVYLMEDSVKYFILKYQPTMHFNHVRDMRDEHRKVLGDEYHIAEHKFSATSDVLSDIFAPFVDQPKLNLADVEAEVLRRTKETFGRRDETGTLTGRSWWLDLLAVLVRHEQRLNRLDATDETNLGKASGGVHHEKMAEFLRAWEVQYWRSEGKHTIAKIVKKTAGRFDPAILARMATHSESSYALLEGGVPDSSRTETSESAPTE